MIGFRLGNFNISSNNDTKRFYFGDGGDRSWTGGISVSTPILEVGFQDFSGKFLKEATNETELKALKNKIKEIKKSNLSKNEKKKEIAIIEKEIIILMDNNLHTQTAYQQNLNKASTYFRINSNGYHTTLDFIGDAWLQNLYIVKSKIYGLIMSIKRQDYGLEKAGSSCFIFFIF